MVGVVGERIVGGMTCHNSLRCPAGSTGHGVAPNDGMGPSWPWLHDVGYRQTKQSGKTNTKLGSLEVREGYGNGSSALSVKQALNTQDPGRRGHRMPVQPLLLGLKFKRTEPIKYSECLGQYITQHYGEKVRSVKLVSSGRVRCSNRDSFD